MADNIPKKNKLKRKRIPNFKRIGKKYKEDTKENNNMPCGIYSN